ncbi:MAG: hypothetical protein A2445_03125 [Candidatus Jacksonbacteria bacterium RIFOXYC2_FULL_44_29]|nr:MAG: putative glucose-1-phosphate thymidylyltransferase [Parcubacteria group bacterium GW2011_GWC2_44_22]OGY75202.1 MAG: hypothetical protein A2240_01205 [Candidatus Jacksonbacteria bacterium RIFOXYA2_FULL_43_12]OGY75878.1 MAG: hypothetical protein A2295_01055 [Candidatus Jacksonbacteria bacterium RIFOXYB2_FULL_44_15]OGY77651.1 MAG: hypothetical protein A2445_03125 [Candidatus Jacksonbacteria bacterium RIFOXYC2_FULL_44_29]OGY79538.1 MAG: hypothetical protein A2550_02210 [Candidatus Jacksonba
MYPITLIKQLDDIEICGLRLGEIDHPDFKYPWELIAWHSLRILKNLQFKIKSYGAKLKVKKDEKDVYIGKEVVVDKFVVFNTVAGPIVIDDNVTIEPFVYIQGPCYIGQNCTIKAHAQIRGGTSIGHDCKIGGEVVATIVQPYTNKAHYGFLGHSYVGSWVNLGAGTTTSNLKNTYGTVRVDYQGQRIDTGMQFLGCVIGDYAKSAINTSIYTGKIIGVNVQIFGEVTENVDSFVMQTTKGKEEFELASALRAQERMFARRGLKPSDQDVELLKQVFEKTRGER